MKIILLRHGKPEIDLYSMLKNKCSSSDLDKLVSSYALAGLCQDDKVTDAVTEMAATCNMVIHSDLPRSIDSAKALELNDKNYCSDAIFREPNLPYANWNFPKLPLVIWLVLFRVLWYFGYSNNAESITKAKERAAIGAIKLQEYSEKYGTVILVGHGFINRFIARELLSAGWSGPRIPGNGYWAYGVYTYIAT